MGEITEELKNEKRYLEHSISNLTDKINSFVNERAELIHRKERLVRARDRVAIQKYVFRDIQKKEKTNINDNKTWKGCSYDSFKSTGSKLISADEAYEKSLDRVHDDMNNEISNLQRQIAHRTGLISSIGAEINGLNTRLTNLFN